MVTEVDIKPARDADFAKTMTQTNMAEYYKKRNMTWDDALFNQSWRKFDNYEVWFEACRVGVVRFSYDENECRLRDLQIVQGHQGKGIGSACIQFAVAHAREKGSESLWLRVFPENPAIALYQRMGFRFHVRNENLCEMVCDV
ncbi:GNAT family N-acetyltransferase [Veronia nyctiphanis]|uniref:GNAT family N-acetyltransferase n=1 Tax=Veronia nyctiphanis TaxID=1278244 RepID=A0A4Q0YGR1_9GAMM|nr:GNAT family N-acetyltransferase [Veronia nyctiphanis]RXJ69473.1 GNAT family N-acetyltransferase [Veronia nyctiphanis]